MDGPPPPNDAISYAGGEAKFTHSINCRSQGSHLKISPGANSSLRHPWKEVTLVTGPDALWRLPTEGLGLPAKHVVLPTSNAGNWTTEQDISVF
jgi:hypothetical protein